MPAPIGWLDPSPPSPPFCRLLRRLVCQISDADVRSTAGLPQRAHFLPRVTQHDGRAIEEGLAATLFDSGVRLRGAVVEATYAASDPPLLKRLREDGVPRLLEPQSQRFTTRRFLEIEQFKSLPYAPSAPITADNFDPEMARSLALGALLFEQRQRCDHYLSAALPYYDHDFLKWVSHNDRLLEEACAANGGAEIDRRPLIATVLPGRQALMKPEFVVNRLLDYPIAGAYVQPLLFDPVRDGPEKLRLYVEFLLALAGEAIPVMASRVGAFGLVLQALGINAFDSGLAQAETSNLAQLNRPLTERERERRREGRGGGPDKRIYLEPVKTTMKGAHADATSSGRACATDSSATTAAASTAATRICLLADGSISSAPERRRCQR